MQYERLRAEARALWGTGFESEPEAAAHLEALLEPRFILLREVWVKHWTGRRIRIDFVAKARPNMEPAFLGSAVFGIEVKAGFHRGEHGAFRSALAQGISYRHSILDDRRCPSVQGQQLQYVFIYPGPPSINRGSTARERDLWEIRGATVLAGKFNVGLLTDTGHETGRDRYSAAGPYQFELCGSPAWCPVRGARFGLDKKKAAGVIGHER